MVNEEEKREENRAAAEEALLKLTDIDKHAIMAYLYDQIELYSTDAREEALEEAAKVVEDYSKSLSWPQQIAAAIRRLKKPAKLI